MDPPREAAAEAPGRLRQVGFLPLLALFYAFTASGPFGYEEIFRTSGPGMAVLFLATVPFYGASRSRSPRPS